MGNEHDNKKKNDDKMTKHDKQWQNINIAKQELQKKENYLLKKKNIFNNPESSLVRFSQQEYPQLSAAESHQSWKWM